MSSIICPNHNHKSDYSNMEITSEHNPFGDYTTRERMAEHLIMIKREADCARYLGEIEGVHFVSGSYYSDRDGTCVVIVGFDPQTSIDRGIYRDYGNEGQDTSGIEEALIEEPIDFGAIDFKEFLRLFRKKAKKEPGRLDRYLEN
jgi:hypothetical protein